LIGAPLLDPTCEEQGAKIPLLIRPVRMCLFLYIRFMKALVITPKDNDEFKFVTDLLKKLGVGSSPLTQDELEDIGMSKLMRGIDKSKKVTRAEIMKKLSA
jgi:hypothetical protein